MTRISTAQSQEASLRALQRRQADLQRAQDRLVGGLRVARPSDDPAAVARAERALADQSRSEGLLRSVEASRTAMSLVESTMGQAIDLMQSARDTLVAAGNGAYGTGERQTLAEHLRQVRGQLKTLANAQNTEGHFLFGGLGGEVSPFVDSGGAVIFQGQAGEAGASLSESLPLAVDGQSIWLGARTGNGVFQTSAQTQSGSAAWIGTGEVSDPGALALASGERYEITFDSPTQFSIAHVDAGGASVPYPDAASNSHAYTPGQAIRSLPGMSLMISGTAVAGDKFTVQPSTADLSVFDALDRVIDVLGAPASQAVNAGQRNQVVQAGLNDVDQVLANFQLARSRAGEALNRFDNLESRTDSRILADKGIRSQAVDLDLAEGASDVATRQTVYQAALQSYSMVRKLSLFDYLGN